MNPRVFKIANFFAFNLLFFALYLNFIHKDKDTSLDPVLVQTSNENYNTEASTPIVSPQPVEKNDETVKAAIN